MEFAWRRLEVERVAAVNRYVTGKEVGVAPDTTPVERVPRRCAELLVVRIKVTNSDPERLPTTRVGRNRYGDDKCEREHGRRGRESTKTPLDSAY